jgi:hypothetical protein
VESCEPRGPSPGIASELNSRLLRISRSRMNFFIASPVLRIYATSGKRLPAPPPLGMMRSSLIRPAKVDAQLRARSNCSFPAAATAPAGFLKFHFAPTTWTFLWLVPCRTRGFTQSSGRSFQ